MRTQHFAAIVLSIFALAAAAHAATLPGPDPRPLLQIREHQLRAAGPLPPIFFEEGDFLVSRGGGFALVEVTGNVSTGPFDAHVFQGVAEAGQLAELVAALDAAHVGQLGGACHHQDEQPVWNPNDEYVLSWFGNKGRTTTLRITPDPSLAECSDTVVFLLHKAIVFMENSIVGADRSARGATREPPAVNPSGAAARRLPPPRGSAARE
ncbi:MAG TPA: hypothetical protein VGE98_07025 [Thermoanaerobaculia bacterium]